jgi:hypothetical protein
MLLVLLIGFFLFSMEGPAIAIAVCVPLGILAVLISSMADAILKLTFTASPLGRRYPIMWIPTACGMRFRVGKSK